MYGGMVMDRLTRSASPCPLLMGIWVWNLGGFYIFGQNVLGLLEDSAGRGRASLIVSTVHSGLDIYEESSFPSQFSYPWVSQDGYTPFFASSRVGYDGGDIEVATAIIRRNLGIIFIVNSS
jgi:hypothetical protein